ncbi:LamG domain-containing protein [Mucilaginibacter sp. UR6-11]|uniref:LamG domain-containing protein n=1 Tax=Mucilaginibacter sp. UR6-11 TaxID=1435644 RepID=UPI001E2EBA09|nr:LamG domain-containing protein [Mucilaginibacter sp. UR6-11]MCC8425271.1 LamG domain-containing protein [Mucilaginibacter sp. UR6-11]
MKNIALLCVTAILLSMGSSCKKFDPVKATTPPIPTPTIDSLKTGLIAYYAFNNNSTTSAVDSSGNGNTATADSIKLTADRSGNPHSAYLFNGTSSFLMVKDNPALRLSNTDFTINTWVNLTHYNTSSGSFVLSKRGTGSANGWGSSITGFAVNGTNILGAPFFNVSGGTDPAAVGINSIQLNKWYMLTTVYNVQKQQISLYINGVLNSVTGQIPTPNASTAADLYIGSDNRNTGSNGYYLYGALDEIRLYSRALSLNDIQKLYVYAK